MKTSLLCGAALAILGLAAAPLNAQTQTTTSSSSSGYVQTSKIIGTKVKTAQGEEVGVVKDVVLDRSNGCMAYTVLSAGGTGTRVAGQAKLVAVPWSVYSVSPDVSFLTVSVERDRIYNGPEFEYSRISDTAYTTNVFSHFGVSAGVGVSGSMSTTTGDHDNRRNHANSNGRLRVTKRICWGERIAIFQCVPERFGFRERFAKCQRIGNGFAYRERKRVAQ